MASNIVCEENVARHYGDNPDLLREYEKIAQSGECPFCPAGIEKQGFSIVRETPYWIAVKNQYPYANTALHLLLVPKRHIISFPELTGEELAEWHRLMVVLTLDFPEGYGLALRAGKVGGVILYHLHWHLIVPEIGTDGQISVNFGIG